MAEPPRDANGVVIPHDDVDIGRSSGLLRYVTPGQMVREGSGEDYRPSSAAFSSSSPQLDRYQGMSVDLEAVMQRQGAPLDVRAADDSDIWIYRIETAAVRDMGHLVGSDPLPTNPYHGQVWKSLEGGRLSRGQREQLRRLAVCVRPGTPPEDP